MQLVFVGGCPRSGCHLMRAVFGRHPAIAVGPDAFLAGMLLARRNIDAQLGSLLAEEFEVDRATADRAFATAISRLLLGRARRESKSWLMEKSAFNVLAFPELARLFPAARFVHLVRDGVDVAASLLNVAWRDPASGLLLPHCATAVAAMRYWMQLTNIGLAAEDDPLLRGRMFRLRYEDLVRAPRETIEDVCAFLDLPFDAACLNPRIDDAFGLETAGLKRLNQPLDLTAIGRGARAFPAPLQAQLRAAASPILARLGYSAA